MILFNQFAGRFSIAQRQGEISLPLSHLLDAFSCCFQITVLYSGRPCTGLFLLFQNDSVSFQDSTLSTCFVSLQERNKAGGQCMQKRPSACKSCPAKSIFRIVDSSPPNAYLKTSVLKRHRNRLPQGKGIQVAFVHRTGQHFHHRFPIVKQLFPVPFRQYFPAGLRVFQLLL